ncbi:MAG: hypothetical protein ACW99G_08480 [Candidatus Thorarchaeota archaeon]
MGPGELRLLRRLVIDPSLRQATLAAELDVTRSAINQIWHKLENDYQVCIRSNLDYGNFGLGLLFGWACDSENSTVLKKFTQWLHTNKFVTRLTKSVMSSTMDARVYFEAVLPINEQYTWFKGQIDRFGKRPYSLELKTELASNVSHHMNLGLFDGTHWDFTHDFRLEASIGAARNYVQILPDVDNVKQSELGNASLIDMVIAAAVESNYHVTASDVEKRIAKLGLDPMSGRTLRRRLAKLRESMTLPYVSINDIGLDRKIMVCIKDDNAIESLTPRLLHAQAGSFPKARVISGKNLTVLDLETPLNGDWLRMSQILSGQVSNTSEICTFIANNHEIEKRLESVVSYLTSRTSHN